MEKKRAAGFLIIVNSLIPVKGFAAMNFYNILFFRKECWEREKRTYEGCVTLNHERIHTVQMRRKAKWLKKLPKLQVAVGGTLFYLCYLWQWILHGYRNNKYEKEAYEHQRDFFYEEEWGGYDREGWQDI